MDKRVFWALFFAILLAAFALRFWDLTKRPIHHDEGVIGWFMVGIEKSGAYTYDPDYHGPLQFHIGALLFLIFGASDWLLRAPQALVGVFIVASVLLFRRQLGDAGTLAAGALIAVSTTSLYYTRYAYSDPYLILFTITLVASAQRFLETRSRNWLLCGAASLALILATKETAFEFLFAAAVFVALEYGYALFRGGWKKLGHDKSAATAFIWKNRNGVALAFAVFAVIYAVFYTTMFLHPENLWLGVSKSVTFWMSRSTSWEGHFKPPNYFFDLCRNYELPILALAVLGLAFSLRTPFSRFLACWAVVMFAISSYVPYKTPWLLPYMLAPMALLGGYGVQSVWAGLAGRERMLAALILLAMLAASAYTAYQISFVDYWKDSIPVNYVASLDDYTQLVQRVENLTRTMNGTTTDMAIISTEEWPLPWSLRDYSHAAWWGKSMPDQTAPIIISSLNDFSEIREDVRQYYGGPEKYEMRPGAIVYLYYRKG